LLLIAAGYSSKGVAIEISYPPETAERERMLGRGYTAEEIAF
jgi:hypothetical protein